MVVVWVRRVLGWVLMIALLRWVACCRRVAVDRRSSRGCAGVWRIWLWRISRRRYHTVARWVGGVVRVVRV